MDDFTGLMSLVGLLVVYSAIGILFCAAAFALFIWEGMRDRPERMRRAQEESLKRITERYTKGV